MTARRGGWMAAAAGALAGMALVATVQGQASTVLDLSFAAFTAGGGESQGGSYTMLGSMGQAQTGVSAGGQYSLSSGYLAGSSVKFRVVAPFISSDH